MSNPEYLKIRLRNAKAALGRAKDEESIVRYQLNTLVDRVRMAQSDVLHLEMLLKETYGTLE